MAEVATMQHPVTSQNSVMVRMAERFGVDAAKLGATLRATAFKGEVSNEQFMALAIVADQYKLNPFTKEIFAFPDRNNGIVPVVSVDGWTRIINEHPAYDGMEFEYGPPSDKHKQAPEWIDCILHRKDRTHPTRVRERLVECVRETGPWSSHPSRMLRHKALIQCARAAFGFAGIYDMDEAERIVERDVTPAPTTAIDDLNIGIVGGKAKAKGDKREPIDVAPTQEPAADDRPPLDLGAGPAVQTLSYAEVRAKIDAAGKKKSADDMADAEDAIRLAPVQFHEELRGIAAEWKAKA